ncbi:MAG TPA: sigma-70 family RNA polymerase sigma factor [Bryobacteraceae bacterium]|nr:sigma-70 family RNA polymerase sigma factor [Bryobacteraceae bacterium]
MRSETEAGSEREATLVRLIEQYKPALWRLVSSYEAEPSRREDLFQEIALGLWQAIPRFRGDSSERTWLYRIAHNIAISALDSRRRRERQESPMSSSADYASPTHAADEAVLEDEQRQALFDAIRRLPAVDRQLMVLYLEELSYEEIEQISGLSQSAIATRLSRGRVRLTEAVRGKERRHDSAAR